MTGVFSQKPIEISTFRLLRLGSSPSWGDLIGGKMKLPFVKSARKPVLGTNDITPEAWASHVIYARYLVRPRSRLLAPGGLRRETTLTSDPMTARRQIGVRLPIGSSTLTLAAHYSTT